MERSEMLPQYEALRAQAEKTCGRKMTTPKDFQILSSHIYTLTNKMVSDTTLRRLWGYQDSGRFAPRRFTLNIIAQYIGYASWDAFCNDKSEASSSSDFVNTQRYHVSDMLPGDRLRIMWNPDRCITVRFEGIDIFVVEESINSKLNVGDRFCCRTFVQNELLYLDRLMREGCQPTNYVCGRLGGVNITLLPSHRGG